MVATNRDFPCFFGDSPQVSDEIGEAWTTAWEGVAQQVAAIWSEIAEQLRPVVDQLERSGFLKEQSPADPRERALWLRQRRNTGPAVRSARAPRAINPRRGR